LHKERIFLKQYSTVFNTNVITIRTKNIHQCYQSEESTQGVTTELL